MKLTIKPAGNWMKFRIILIFLLIGIAYTLTGCTAANTLLYRVNIQQGNILSTQDVRQIHSGMTKEAVCMLLGPPLLMDTFNENRWTYIYTFKPGKGKFVERYLILYFKNSRVWSIKSHNIPELFAIPAKAGTHA